MFTSWPDELRKELRTRNCTVLTAVRTGIWVVTFDPKTRPLGPDYSFYFLLTFVRKNHDLTMLVAPGANRND